MADQQFAVVFRGRLAEGADAAQVRANLAKLFNADAARVAGMFSGQPVVIKKGVDAETAAKYVAALRKAGAIAEVVAAGGQPKRAAPAVEPAARPAPAAAPPAPATGQPVPAAPKATAPAAAAVAAVPAQLHDVSPAVRATLVRGAPPEALDVGIAEPGVLLVEPVHVAPPAIDTSHLDLAELGVDLIEYRHIPAPLFDLSALHLDPPGTTLVEPKRTPPPEYDLSRLSLDER